MRRSFQYRIVCALAVGVLMGVMLGSAILRGDLTDAAYGLAGTVIGAVAVACYVEDAPSRLDLSRVGG